MANRILTIALMLTAVDQMSGVVENATNNIDKSLDKIKDGYRGIIEGIAGVYSSKLIYDNTVAPMMDAFEAVQSAGNELKKSMMRDGGLIDNGLFNKFSEQAEKMSNRFHDSKSAYMEMYRYMLANDFSAKEIFGGLGEQTAMFARTMHAQAATSVEFMAGLKNDFKFLANDLPKALDMTYRMHYYGGVGKTGDEALSKLKEVFSKAALGANTLDKNMNPMDAFMGISGLSTPFLRRQMDAAQVGGAFMKMFQTIGSKRLNDFNELQQTMLPKDDQMIFFDNNGSFLGMTNLIGQFDKMKKLTSQQISDLIGALVGGKTSVTSAMADIMAGQGVESFKQTMDVLFGGGSYAQGWAIQAKSLEERQAELNQRWANAKTVIGEALLPYIENVISIFGEMSTWVENLSKKHPIIIKLIYSIVGMTVAFMALGGSIRILVGVTKYASGGFGLLIGGVGHLRKELRWLRMAWAWNKDAVYDSVKSMKAWVVQAARVTGNSIKSALGVIRSGFISIAAGTWRAVTAAWAWTAALLANPMTWIVIGIIAAVSLLAYSVYLIIKHWDEIKQWFSDTWNSVKIIFNAAIAWFMGLGSRFLQAGKNIISNIYNGVTSGIHKVIDKVKGMVQKIRNMLPFSPAKEGPLRDIHKIRLVETIAEGLKPNALVEKMSSIAGSVMNFSPSISPASPNARGRGAGVQITFAPVYNAAPGSTGYAADRNAFMDDARRNARDLVQLISDQQLRNGLKQF